MSNEREEN